MFGSQVLSGQQSLGSMGQLLDSLLGVWAIDLIVISLSVDEVSLTLSIIPFICIFPTALMICLSNSEEFARIIALAMLTIVFVIARYLANSL
jgi:predicted ferric reductase